MYSRSLELVCKSFAVSLPTFYLILAYLFLRSLLIQRLEHRQNKKKEKSGGARILELGILAFQANELKGESE